MAATFEKAKTYVFTEPVIRDREVGGSNPLAPTTSSEVVQEEISAKTTEFVYCHPSSVFEKRKTPQGLKHNEVSAEKLRVCA